MTKTKSLLLTAGIVLATAFTFCGCKEEGKEKKETPSAEATTEAFTDSRDSKKYKTVKIGEQVWMAENLNYEAQGSKCYGEGSPVVIGDDGENPITTTLSPSEVQANCTKYGRLYNWETAMKVCSAGWHLPSDKEWQTLVDFAGGNDVAGAKLKAKSGWNENGNGTDDYGFSALPGGNGFSPDGFAYVGINGNWWSAAEENSNFAYYRKMNFTSSDVNRDSHYKLNLFSVRCIKDK